MRSEQHRQTAATDCDLATIPAPSKRHRGGAAAPPPVVLGAGFLVAAYAVAWAASAMLLRGRSDADLFFWPVAQFAASGHPLLIYSTNTMGAGPYANGPLGVLPLVPVALLFDVGGWAGNAPARTIASNVVFALFSVAMAFVAVRAVARGRGDVDWRLGTYAAFLLAPPLWISVADYGHFEQPIEIAFALLAVILLHRGRLVPAGMTLGLALLTRTTAVLYIIPFLLLPIATRSLKEGAGVAAAALMAAVGFAPFLAADWSDVVHSLVTYRGSEPISGGSISVLVVGGPLSSFVQHADIYLVLTVAAVLCCSLLFLRPAAATSIAGLSGLLVIAASCFPMLAKTVYPYYVMEPCALATVWWLARPGSAANWRIAVPLLLTVDAMLVKQSFSAEITTPRVVIGILSSAILAVAIVLVFFDLIRMPSRWSARIRTPVGLYTSGTVPEDHDMMPRLRLRRLFSRKTGDALDPGGSGAGCRRAILPRWPKLAKTGVSLHPWRRPAGWEAGARHDGDDAPASRLAPLDLVVD